MNKRLISMFLALCMIVTMLPVSAMAEEIHTTIGGSGEIISFAPMTETKKAVSLGTSIEDLELPETLTATVRTAVPADENSKQDSGSPETATPTTAAEPEWKETTGDIPVEWASPDYDMDTEGAYVFTPVIVGYTVSAPLPELTVTVGVAIMGRGMVAPLSATTYNIWVGGVQVTDTNKDDVLDDGATVTYNSGSNTLTLSDATITTPYTFSAARYGIYAPDGLNLKLVGTNAITLGSGDTAYGICTQDSDLQISAEHNGSLTITTNGNFGIYSDNLTINSGEITAVSAVIWGTESVSISEGTVTSTGGTQGIVGKTITVSGGTMTASGSGQALTNFAGSPNFTGMQVTASIHENGSDVVPYNAADLVAYKYIKVEPGATPPVLTEVGDRTALQSAITGATGDLDLKLSDSYIDTAGKLTIPGTCNYNITIDLNGRTLAGGSVSAIEYLGSGTLTITDSQSGGMVTSNAMGTIYAKGTGTVNLSGGTVRTTGSTESVAIWVGGNTALNITGGLVIANGFANYAIYSQNGTVNISGGTVSATGTNGKAILGETGAAGQLSISGGTISAVNGTAIENNSTRIKTGTPIIIQGKKEAMAFEPTLDSGVQGGASTNYDGSGSVAYNTTNLATYKYLKFGDDVISPVLSAGNVNRINDTEGTIEFTTDKAGTAYYLVVNSSASAPTIAQVKEAGASLGSVSGTVTGKAVTLTAGAKDIYVVVEDSAGNISTPLKIEAAAYAAPPVLSAGNVQRASDTAATIGFTTDKAGTAYYLVVNSGATPPPAPMGVKVAGTSLGSVSGAVAGKAVTLTAGAKDIYVVVEDSANNISTPLKIPAAAYVPPVLSAGSVNRTSDTVATIGFTTDKSGIAIYLVMNSGASAPTNAEVAWGGGFLGGLSGTVTGKAVTLTAGAKDIYVVVFDSAGNISAPLKIEAAAYVAPDTTPPVLSAGNVTRTSDTAATIGFITDEAGTAYYLVVNSGASAPTSMAVKAGTSLGSVSGTVTDKAVTLAAGAKDIYVVVEDLAGNISTPLKIEAAAYVAPDTTAPTVISVTVPHSGTYSTGNNLDFTVSFDENVAVTGTPHISLTFDSFIRYAVYISGSGTSALVFRYTVQEYDSDADGININALNLNSGTIKDGAGNDANLALNNVGSTAGILVHTPVATTITSQPAPQTVNAGQGATFSVTATGEGLTYRWQVDTGSGFTNITNAGVYSGATTATLTITGVTAGMNGYQYRAVVEGTYSPVATSTSALLTVNAAPTYTITADPVTKDFGSLTIGYIAPAAQTVTITNTGNSSVTLTQPTGTNYTIGTLSTTTLAANGTAIFTVEPKAGLAVGAHNETLTVSTDHSTNATVDLSFTVTAAPTYTITANPTSKNFGSLVEGYSAPAAQTVTITNTGNSSVTLIQPTSTNYTIGTLSTTTLAANGTATFTVTPKTGLAVGNYNETLTVSTNHSTNATVELSFSVTAVPNYTITFNPNGGTVSETSRSVAPSTAVGALPTPTRSGSYSFDGWYTAASGGTQISAGTTVSANVTYYAHWTYTGGGGGGGGSSSNDNSSPVIVTPPAPDKPNSPTQGEIKVPGTVDGKGNVTVSLTDKTVTDAFNKALAEAKKNGTEQNGITVVLRVDTGNKTGSNVTVNLPKAVQDTIIAKKIVNTIVVVDNPDIRVGMDLATVQEINKQAKSDVNITATRTDSGKLTTEAKKAIGSRSVFDLKVNYGNGKAVSSFGSGSVSVTIPYTLGANEKAGNVQAVYVDSKGKVHWLINSVYDSVEKVLRFSTDHFSTYGIGYKQTGTAFTDIAGHWAKEDIEFVASRGLFSGTSATTLSPNTAMTRGMFVTALGRLANANVSGYTKSSFTDVKNDAYYMGYIEWANKNNIVNGVGNGKFAPDQSITREQMAVIMSNYAKTISYTLPKVHIENIFTDNAKISTYSKEAVKQMQMAGVISGKNGNLYDPQGTATRAEVSAVLRRFVELAISSDTAQGWTMNDSGKWMYFKDGKPLTGKQDIDGATYTFDQYGVTADVPKNLRYTTYTVQKGDSFWSISRKLGCPMSELERLNNKSRFSLILPGDVLRVPEK